LYEPHPDNLARIEKEQMRMRALNDECQAAIASILERENIEARIVFYPVPGKKQQLR